MQLVIVMILSLLNCFASAGPKEDKQQELRIKQRAKVIAEIISSEKYYLLNLEYLKVQFEDPLERLAPQLFLEKYTVFQNIDAIAEIHKTSFLKDLLAIDMKNNPPSDPNLVSRAFTTLGNQLLEEYSKFIRNVPTSIPYSMTNKAWIDYYALLLNDETTLNSVKRFRKQKFYGLAINSFLITAVQRLPRYLLLLKQLADVVVPLKESYGDKAKDTTADAQLQVAILKMESIIKSCNSILGENDMLTKSQEIFRASLTFGALVKEFQKLEVTEVPDDAYLKANNILREDLRTTPVECALFIFKNVLVIISPDPDIHYQEMPVAQVTFDVSPTEVKFIFKKEGCFFTYTFSCMGTPCVVEWVNQKGEIENALTRFVAKAQ